MFLGPNAKKIQTMHAINSLPALVTAHGRTLFSSVPLKRAASQVDEECSIALANVLLTILEESMLQKQEVVNELLPVVLQHFKGQKQTDEVWAAWYDVLMVSAPHFDKQTAEEALLTPALKQSAPSSEAGIVQRLRACRLLAAAAVGLRGNDEVRSTSVLHCCMGMVRHFRSESQAGMPPSKETFSLVDVRVICSKSRTIFSGGM
jgi:hypothetical protein